MMVGYRRQTSTSRRGLSALRRHLVVRIFIFLAVLHSSSILGVVVRAEESVSPVAESEAVENPRGADDHVCAPPVDCSMHEQTIRELTESLEALRGALLLDEPRGDASAWSRSEELRAARQVPSHESCQARIQEVQDAHQAELWSVAAASRSHDDNQDATISKLRAQLDASQEEAGAWQKRHDDLLNERETLATQLERTASQLESLLTDHEQVVHEHHQLASAVRDLETRAEGAGEVEAKRTRGLEMELESAKARLEAAHDALFETRQELHQVWERYVEIRDAWWNVPSRWEIAVEWGARQWRRFDKFVDHTIVAVKPYLDRGGRVVATILETVQRYASYFANVIRLVLNEWFLPNWQWYVQPHLDRTGRFVVAQFRALLALAAEQGGAASSWAGKQWSKLVVQTAPQREQFALLIQPTVDVLRAQFAPAWTSLHGAWTTARARVAESTWFESTALGLYKAEFGVVSTVATIAGVARDYLTLQNAPIAVVRPLQWIHEQAAAHVAAATSGDAPPPQFMWNVLLTTTATALILVVLWWALKKKKKRPSSARMRVSPSPSSSPYRSPPKQEAIHKTPKSSSPDLLTEASSIPDSSLQTPRTHPR